MFLLFTCLYFMSCIGFDLDPGKDHTYWNISNCTVNDIVIKTDRSQDTVKPNQRKSFTYWGYVRTRSHMKQHDENHDFNDINNFWGRIRRDTSKMIVDMRMILEDVDTAHYPRRVWRFIRKDDSGKQFFNGNNWIKTVNSNGLDFTYTFELYPEDFGLDERVVARQ